jgi:type IV pilus assembly protein PilO
MATRTVPSRAVRIDFAAQARALQRQFVNLDPKDPSRWPLLPRILLCVAVAAACFGLLWYFWLGEFQTELETAQAQETTLRADYQQRAAKAANLQALQQQREQVQQYVIQLEKQLPSRAEMAALLSDINQAGVGRSLQFELFRPGQVVVRDYDAELPIAVRVTGTYHDMGAFVADIAHLPRIVTLNNLAIVASKDSGLAMDATARTFRYLDEEEIEAQRKTKKAAQGTKR